jgi:hypothetical protein
MAAWAVLSELNRRATISQARHGKGMHGYVVLGALTPDQAAEQIFPASKVTKAAGHNQAVRDLMTSSAAAGQILNVQGAPGYVPGTAQCAAAPSGAANDVGLAGKAGSLALTGVNSAGLIAAGPTLGISLAISGIVGIFSTIFNHHAQAVAKEQSVLCAAVPAANNYLKIIAQAVQQGQATPAQGIQALQSLLSDFRSSVSSIMHGNDPTSSGECNAACVEYSILATIVAYQVSAYQDLANASTPAATGGSGPITAAPVASGSTLTVPAAAAATASSPSWLPIAALVFAGILVAKVL